MEILANKIPAVGSYSAKFTYVEPQLKGEVAYGHKHQWEGLGELQNQRIKEAQFGEDTKLCMCILKALDQEPVDLKNNKEL